MPQSKAASPSHQVIISSLAISLGHIQHKHTTRSLSDFTDSGEAISARFGGDCTQSAIENRFRRIKSDAKLMNDALANGVDPFTLPIGGDDAVKAPSGSRGKNGDNGPADFLPLSCTFPSYIPINSANLVVKCMC